MLAKLNNKFFSPQRLSAWQKKLVKSTLRGSISPTFYKQLFLVKLLHFIFVFLVKSIFTKMLVIKWCWIWLLGSISPTFYASRSQKHKQTVKSSVSFCAFGICSCKSWPKMLMKLTTGGDGLVLQRIFSAQNVNHLLMHLWRGPIHQSFVISY